MQERSRHALRLSEVAAGGPIPWPKKPEDWEHLVHDRDVVYEDDHVIAFHDPVREEHEAEHVPGEVHVTIIPKRHLDSLMDLGVADEPLSNHLLHGIQQVAYKLDLQHHGFEVRAHVQPPYQHRPGLAFKIRAGKPPKPKDPAGG